MRPHLHSESRRARASAYRVALLDREWSFWKFVRDLSLTNEEIYEAAAIFYPSKSFEYSFQIIPLVIARVKPFRLHVPGEIISRFHGVYGVVSRGFPRPYLRLLRSEMMFTSTGEPCSQRGNNDGGIKRILLANSGHLRNCSQTRCCKIRSYDLRPGATRTDCYDSCVSSGARISQ